ncbi:Tumor-related protein [Zea mays]|uniref:Tumor-related protein n=1 Tax=Zea mays TaxID=4577 RepID=A0A1D6HPM3_MAIZE|nr:Tumor-related protein [Zea mays]AQK76224.1 Tumor-related protein [Zea mays]AQK76225.1 Tumor-related protein [Zea mays]
MWEKNSRKGRFCPSKLKGKRVIELGAGCGLAGFGMALLGGDVTTTDQAEVLPLLMRNVERNRSWISQSNPDSDILANTKTDSVGSITVAELDWGNKEHIKAVEPPFDYIVGTDVLGYEIRSTTVHEKMMEMWKSNFIVKTVSRSKMDVKYQHPSIHLYMMDLKAPLIPEVEAADNGNYEEEVEVAVNQEEDEDPGVKSESCSGSSPEAKSGSLDDWEIRRCGAMAARLLKDVKL